ncbi:hypothetical protein HK098_000052 [Nowakowskiella sp. JEL0407]|nr:hypothetical protein HK098_000052 [Nowakowskiella sp. JEL0407]
MQCSGLIDTAAVYRNEEDIGEAISQLIRNGLVQRQDLFITTKIAPKDQGEDKAYKAVLESLRKLGPDVKYLDLVLIHWPGTQGTAVQSSINRDNRLGSWRALERLYKEHQIRSIGISNFNIQHLQNLMENCEILPHVNQVELHPLYNQSSLREYCRNHNIFVQAYSSFGEGRFLDGSINVDELRQIASMYSASVAQILLAWGMQIGCGVLPKASSKERLLENLHSINVILTDEEVNQISGLMLKYGEKKFCWDPNGVL